MTELKNTEYKCENYDNCIKNENNIQYFLDTNKLSLVAVGCWGVYCEDGEKTIVKYKKDKVSYEKAVRGQKSVMQKMKEYVSKNKVSEIYLTGDNIYQKSVKNDEKIEITDIVKNKGFDIDLQIQEGFMNCFFKNIQTDRFFLALGNHDIENCYILSKQFEFDKWILPSLYYSVHYILKDFEVKIIILDTNMFVEEPTMCNGLLFSQNQILKQSEWAINQIVKKENCWNIVIGHNPFFANGHKQSKPIILNNTLKNLLEKMKPDLYICADEHNQQFLSTDPPTVVAGTGGTALDDILENTIKETVFQSKNFGFVGYGITREKIDIEFISVDNSVFKTSIIKK